MSVFYVADKKHMIEVYGDEVLDLTCAGAPLKAIVPNTVDAAKEKHVPVATYDATKNEVHVTVGSVAHPMTEEHLIEYIILVTKKGVQRVDLTATNAPEVTFRLMDGDTPVKVLEYCNLHGLWQAEI
ncbi:putative superoxide reductase [Selenomonas sp. FOBRC6]|uniref:desulfoferrodoxin family protein n=1 Tax=Selenomonas sp. FOBRC6 TaxID=936572 RepID=UPI0002781A39|nr:desulfoferrodoxin family protein [Selenomonas sp. FOBRC6]EJO19296.1 putative superoxide reductase [Selenomonas sp. FOBRC6]